MRKLLLLLLVFLATSCDQNSVNGEEVKNDSTDVKVSDTVSGDSLENKENAEDEDSTQTTEEDSTSTSQGAISGEASKVDTSVVLGDSIIGWNTIAGNVVLENGDNYALTWVDQFDSSAINKRWSFGSWTFAENASQFRKSQVQLNDTTLSLVMEFDSADVAKDRDVLSGEAYTAKKYQFGRYVCRMKPTNPSGVVSSFFLIDIVDGTDWYEIDIEFVGADTKKVQFNLRSRLPEESSIVDEAVMVDLPFDASEDFHTYTIDWTLEYISFYVDGKLAYTYDDKEFVGRQAHEQSVRFNYWPTNLPGWTGPFEETSLPIATEYDYIAVYAN